MNSRPPKVARKMSTGSISTAPPPPRAVTFSRWCEVNVIPRDERPNGERWYSKGDREVFYRRLIIDAGRMSRYLTCAPREKITPDHLDECRGMESFLHRDMLFYLQSKKKAHIKAIVGAQHVFDKEELRLVSENSSCQAREGALCRARGIGSYLNDMKE